MQDSYFKKKALWLNHLLALAVFGATFLLSFFAASNDWIISTYLSLVDGLLAAVLGALIALQLSDIARSDCEIREPSPQILSIYRSMKSLVGKPKRTFARDEYQARLREFAEAVSQGDSRGDVIFDLEQLDGRMRTLHNQIVKEALRGDQPEPLRLVHYLSENDAYFSNILWQQNQRNVDRDLRVASSQSSRTQGTVRSATQEAAAAQSETQFRTTLQRLLIYDEGRYRVRAPTAQGRPIPSLHRLAHGTSLRMSSHEQCAIRRNPTDAWRTRQEAPSARLRRLRRLG